MDSYSILVDQILKNSTLSNAVKEMMSDIPDALNLITPNWKETLENNRMFKDFLENANHMFRSQPSNDKIYCFEFLKDKPFNILVAAECRFPKGGKKQDKLCLNTINCKPLGAIAKVMWSDLGSDIFITDEFKFEFTSCSLLGCDQCKKYSAKFQEIGYTIEKIEQPCIGDTKIYDGKCIVNRFTSQIKNMFNPKFIALLNIKLDRRYYYIQEGTKRYRIGGHAYEMIAFLGSKLSTPKIVDLGDLVYVNAVYDLPAADNSESLLDKQFWEDETTDVIEEDKKRSIDDEVFDAIPNNLSKKPCLSKIVEATEEFIL